MTTAGGNGSKAGDEIIAMLVVTSLAGHGVQLARVRTTRDVESGEEEITLVRSLPALLSVVESWWHAHWGAPRDRA